MSRVSANGFPVKLSVNRPAIVTCLLLLCLLMVFTSCSSYNRKFEFEKSLETYNDMVRWHKLDEAGLFAADAVFREFMARLKAAEDMRTVEYRILKVQYDEVKNEAEVRVEIQYYLASKNILKSLVDVQKWVYMPNGKQWKLMSLFPEFK